MHKVCWCQIKAPFISFVGVPSILENLKIDVSLILLLFRWNWKWKYSWQSWLSNRLKWLSCGRKTANFWYQRAVNFSESNIMNCYESCLVLKNIVPVLVTKIRIYFWHSSYSQSRTKFSIRCSCSGLTGTVIFISFKKFLFVKVGYWC
jgi:hypothetical protein